MNPYDTLFNNLPASIRDNIFKFSIRKIDYVNDDFKKQLQLKNIRFIDGFEEIMTDWYDDKEDFVIPTNKEDFVILLNDFIKDYFDGRSSSFLGLGDGYMDIYFKDFMNKHPTKF
jgi:hypothetical protein